MCEIRNMKRDVADYRLHIRNVVPAQATRARVIIIHGYGEHSGRYDDLSRGLARCGIASTSCDLPGHGQSSGNPGVLSVHDVIQTIIEELNAVSRQLNGDVPSYLFGHSLGGLLVVGHCSALARTYAGIILSSPVIGGWSAINAFLHADEIPPSLVRARHLSRRDSFATSYDSDPLIYRGALARSTLREAADVLDELSHSTSPLAGYRVQWIHGSADRIVPVGQAMRALADLGVTDLDACIYPDARHEVLNDNPADSAFHRIRDFIYTSSPSTGH